MRVLLKLLAFLILGPLALGIALVLGIVAIVGLPLLWEQIVSRFSSPPQDQLGN